MREKLLLMCTAAAVAAVAGSASGVLTAHTANALPPTSTVLSTSQPADGWARTSEGDFATGVDQLIAVGETRYPDVFAGEWVSDSSVTVFLTHRDVMIEDALVNASGLAPNEVDFAIRTPSVADQGSMMARVLADVAVLAAGGIEIVGVGVDLTSGQVGIGVIDMTSAEEDALRARYGQSVVLTNVPAADRPIAASLTVD